MEQKSSLWTYLGRFVLVFLAVYFVTGTLFLSLVKLIPEGGREALDFPYFAPFRSFGVTSLISQTLRSLVLALLFYPFYSIVINSSRSKLILFGALFGVGVFGSIEPIPGSMEGLIYTVTTLPEHGAVIVAAAVQTFLFVNVFVMWERTAGNQPGGLPDESPLNQPIGFKGYLFRFLALHLLTYWTVGILFYQLTDYETKMAEMEIFTMYRPLESPIMVFGVLIGQILRGPLLALLLFPFTKIWINRKHGWLLLFSLLFGLSTLGSPLFLHLTVVDAINATSPGDFIRGWSLGVPEIVTQMLVFAFLFFRWEKRRMKR